MIENEVKSYFPELENQLKIDDNKWGILNVYLTKCNKVITNYQWKYAYFDGEKLRVLSSYDLTKLRQRVLKKGLDWIITNKKYAIDSYKLNNELLAKHKLLKKGKVSNNLSSGVKYVYRRPDKGAKKGFYWTYVNRLTSGQRNYSSVSLKQLEERIKQEGLPWFVVNPEVYSKIIEQEKN